jgi:DNA-binding NarL/FixJ family response regulator
LLQTLISINSPQISFKQLPMKRNIATTQSCLPTLTIALSDKLKAELIILLESKKMFKVKKVLASNSNVFEDIETLESDYLLIDTDFPCEGGFGFLKKLSRIKPRTKVILYSNSTNPDLLKIFLNSPAQGFIQKGCSLKEFIDHLKAIFEGRRIVYSKIESSNERIQFKEDCKSNEITYDLSVLTERELDVWELLSEAKMEKQIAESLYISLNTVKTHKSNISKKLGIKNDRRLSTFVMQNT